MGLCPGGPLVALGQDKGAAWWPLPLGSVGLAFFLQGKEVGTASSSHLPSSPYWGGQASRSKGLEGRWRES